MTDRELLELIAAQVGALTKDLSELKVDVFELKVDVSELKGDVSELKEGQKNIKKDIESIIDQTAGLIEFRYEINEKVDKLTEEFSTIEIVTSKNWNDIARLKAAR